MNIFPIITRLFVFLLFFVTPSYAISEEEYSDGTTRTLLDYIEDFVDVPEGATDWRVFGQAKEISIELKDAEGFDLVYTKPDFTPDIRALDGKRVAVKGYMFPLESTEEQKLFLFGPFPISCPFHYHVGPSLVLEVHAKEKPVPFSYDPIVISGTLELVYDDPEYSVFYRLRNSELIE